jgi:hypothetical protein
LGLPSGHAEHISVPVGAKVLPDASSDVHPVLPEALIPVQLLADVPLRLRPSDVRLGASDDGHQGPSAVAIPVRLVLDLGPDEDVGRSAVRAQAIPDARLPPHSAAVDAASVVAVPCTPDAVPFAERSFDALAHHPATDALGFPDAVAQLVSLALLASEQGSLPVPQQLRAEPPLALLGSPE